MIKDRGEGDEITNYVYQKEMTKFLELVWKNYDNSLQRLLGFFEENVLTE